MNDSFITQDPTSSSVLSSNRGTGGGYAAINPYISLTAANLTNPNLTNPNLTNINSTTQSKSQDNNEKYGFLAIKAMITSALIWVTIASWIDIAREYMLVMEPASLEGEIPVEEIEQRPCFQDRLRLRLRRRAYFAIMVTLLTIAVAWWFHWYMARI